MNNIKQAREVTQEIAEMLQGADEKQKILIKGILIGASACGNPAHRDKEMLDTVPESEVRKTCGNMKTECFCQ